MKQIIAVILFCCCAQVARGQCTGYTITGTSVNLLSPTDAAAQGATTVTLSADKSHNETAGLNTVVTFKYSSNNTNSPLALNYKFSDQPSWTHFWIQPSGASGSFTLAMDNGFLNRTAIFQLTGSGPAGSTTDRVTIATTNASPGIISADHIRTNAYYQLVSNFGGGSMMQNCGECQGGEIQKCLLATHTPLFDATMTNPQSGEMQTLSNIQAGNVAKAQESVSGTASAMISVLPGDHPTGSTTNKIYCTMFGWVMAQQWNPGIPDFEWSITEVETIASTCTLALRFFEQNSDWGVQCNVAWKKPPATADRCSVASQVPDFNPETVWDEQDCKIPGDCGTADLPPPNGTNQNFPKFWYAASQGVRFGGPPAPGQPDPIIAGGAHGWRYPLYVLKQYIPGGPDEDWWILDLLNIAVAKGTGLPIDCANRDKGTYPIQTPW